MIESLLIALVAAFIGQTSAVWLKLGQVGKLITQNKCPFGRCPLMDRAKKEASQEREY